jgi:DNA-binding transcriptional LysR family regulator
VLSRLNDVVVFVAVADAGGFTAAARRLGITTAAVSKSITRLEQRLSTRLFTRTTRTVHMTDAGARYYTRCRPALDELARGEDEALEEAGSMRGRIRVELPTTLGRMVVIPVLSEFLRSYPDIALDIRLNDRVVDLVGESVDVAVRFGSLKDSSLTVHKLGLTRICHCASPAYLEQYGTPRTLADLEQHRLITYLSQQTRRPYMWTFQVDGETHTMLPNSRTEIDDSGANRSLGLAGAGIVQELSFHVRDDLLAGRLLRVLPEYDAPGLDVSLVFPSGRAMPSRVRALVRFLRTRITAAVLAPKLS